MDETNWKSHALGFSRLIDDLLKTNTLLPAQLAVDMKVDLERFIADGGRVPR